MPSSGRLIVAGAGGFGRELAAWLPEWAVAQRAPALAGFLDEDPGALGDRQGLPPVLGSVASYAPQPGDLLVCGAGHPLEKQRIIGALRRLGVRFATVTHPTARVGPRLVMGEGCVICANAVLTCDIVLGAFVTLNIAATVGHDVRIGDYSTLSSHSDVTGRAQLGTAVFLGSHAVVAPKGRVGDFATVGAGSLVLREVKSGATVLGVPAKQVAGF